MPGRAARLVQLGASAASPLADKLEDWQNPADLWLRFFNACELFVAPPSGTIVGHEGKCATAGRSAVSFYWLFKDETQ